MAGASSIEWTERTWNPIKGCKVLSPGCTNCYAMRLAGTRLKAHSSYAGLTIDTKAGPVWTGEMRFDEKALLEPLSWRTPRVIFVNSMSDLFAEGVPDEWIDKIYAVMALTPHHTYQVLTKRPARMRAYFAGIPESPDEPAFRDALIEGEAQSMWAARNGGADPSLWLAVHMPLANVWHGVSAEDQTRADERIPDLLRTPSAVRFISAEPLIAPLSLISTLGGTQWMGGQRGCAGSHHGIGTPDCPRERHHHHDERCGPGLDLVIVGGENGPRPTHPDWVRQLRDECATGDTPFFFKQWGTWGPDQVRGGFPLKFMRSDGTFGGFFEAGCAVVEMRGKRDAGRELDGRTHDALPEIRA